MRRSPSGPHALARAWSALARFTLLALLALSPACKKTTTNLCTGDEQCAPGFSCDPNTGACACNADTACAAAEFCNAAGFCQPKLLCQSTADCAKGSICDSPTGVCIPQDTCTLDLQCPLGQVCKDFGCVPGCKVTGDCALSSVCRACAPGTSINDCPVGNLCVQGPCDSQLSCPYGDVCAPQGSSSETYCQKDTRGPFCESCANQPGTQYYCQEGAQNFCLIDASLPLGQANFCGVDCSQGQECPNGYQCRDIRIVTAQNCRPENGLSACPSPQTNPPCDPAKNHEGQNGGIVNDDCLAVAPPLIGAVCDPKTSRCTPQCLGTGEANVQAFCSCIQDSDCPQDSCDSATHRCNISGKSCFVGDVPDDCQAGAQQIFCVKANDAKLGDVGYCRIGQNCAPAPGYTCKVLRGN